MKRLIFMCMIIFFMISPSTSAAKSEISPSFSEALEKHLRAEVSYYDENSFVVLDEMTTNGTVTKVNGDEITEYESNFTIAFVSFEEKRDGFIYFDKRELHIWDNNNQEFLSYSNITQNEIAMDFYSSYIQTTEKEMNPWSLFLFMLMLTSIIIIPMWIVLFVTPSRSSFNSNPFLYE